MPAIDQIDPALLGPYRIITITYPPVQETVLDTPEVLSWPQPDDPQINVEITADLLPIFDPAPLNTPKYHACIYTGGTAPDASHTIYCFAYKNSTPVADGTLDATVDQHWTQMAFFSDIIEGDILSVKLASRFSTDALWDWWGFAMFTDTFQLAPDDQVLARVIYSLPPHPQFVAGTRYDTGPFHAEHEGLFTASLGEAVAVLDAVVMQSPHYAGRVHYGNFIYGTGVAGIVGASHPIYLANSVPFNLLFRETQISI